MPRAPLPIHVFRSLGYVIALGCGLLVLSGCGTTSSFRDPAYTKQDFRDGAVGFIPMRFTEIGMEAYEEFRKAFKKEPENGGETKLAEAFNKAFLNSVKGKAKHLRILDSGPVNNPYNQFETKQILNKGKKSQSAMRIYIPLKSAVDSLTPPVRFIITGRNVNFSYKEEQTASFMTPGTSISTPGGTMFTAGTMGGGGKSKIITLSMSYAIWDYQKDAPVSYGKFTTDMSASYFFTQGEWLGMMEKAAGEVVRHSPLF